jgi:ketosteroid isomerase-like protein
MKRLVSTAAIALLTVAAAGCNKIEPSNPAAAQAAMSESDAAKIADATIQTWKSMDAARIKALYSPSVEAFDFAVPGLNKNRADFDKRQDAYVAAKLDGAKEIERNIQVLSPDVFVMSGTWDMTSTAMPANNGIVRCTDVFQKDQSGNWPIVNEHCSPAPKPA